MEEATQASPTPPQQELHPDPTDSVTENAPANDEAAEEKEVQQDEVEQEKNTHVRLVGVPVMGLDLLAEMKARQEKMAVKKVSQIRVKTKCRFVHTKRRNRRNWEVLLVFRKGSLNGI